MSEHQSTSRIKLSIIYEELNKFDKPISVKTLIQFVHALDIQAHLVVLVEPYLEKIITGEKTIESRFTKRQVLPYKHVFIGDILFLKRSSGPLCAITSVKDTSYFGPISKSAVEDLFKQFKDALCVDPLFIKGKFDSKYASLLFLGSVLRINPIQITKTDRRPWIKLYQNPTSKDQLQNNMGRQLELFSATESASSDGKLQ